MIFQPHYQTFFQAVILSLFYPESIYFLKKFDLCYSHVILSENILKAFFLTTLIIIVSLASLKCIIGVLYLPLSEIS